MMDWVVIDGDGFSIDVQRRHDYLFARVHGGQDSLATSIGYWTRLWQEVERHGFDRLLVVEQLQPTAFENSDMQALCAALVALGYGRIRIGFVPRWGTEQDNEQVTIIGADLGLTAMVFSDEWLAERWLRYG